MIYTTIHFLTPLPIAHSNLGRQIYSVLLKYFPSHVPQRYGDSEPIRNRFNQNDINGALKCWGEESYLTCRENPAALMHVIFAGKSHHPVHSSLSFIDFELAGAHELPTLREFVSELSQLLAADFAMAHILTRSEFDAVLESRLQRPTSWPAPSAEKIVADLRKKAERDGFERIVRGSQCGQLFTVHLEKCLQNLYWFNVLGPAYVEIFGREKIIATPANSVEMLNYGGVAIALTEDLVDTREAWDAFEKTRASCKAHLNSNVFCDPAAHRNYRYRTPKFIFQSMTEAH